MGPSGTPRGAVPARRDRHTSPEPLADHAHLNLSDLRGYRAALTNEESNVSYWGRLVKARLNVVRSALPGVQRGSATALDTRQLRAVLTPERVGAGRRALLAVVARDDLAALPDLAELWQRRVPSGDEAARLTLEQDLLAAEERLSDYRGALLHRLDEATGELVARYRAQPALCLAVLPLPPARPPHRDR